MTGPLAPPLAALLELTHRCPLQCPYCSNPLELERVSDELDTAAWQDVLDQLADLGVLQVNFSGGEPGVRRDLVDLVHHARQRGLYSNLITSGVAIDRERLAALAAAGLDHVQISFQDAEPDEAARFSHYPGAQEKKLAFAAWVGAAGLPLTVNAVVHRQNVARVGAMISLALDLGAARLEVAHVQYYGWALANRTALLPSRAELDQVTATVEAARERYRGRLVIDYVIPDYHARQPKACMGGWGRRFLNITPSGKVLPCHAAETIPDLPVERVGERPIAAIWQDGPAFTRFRGDDWMPEPCRGCDQREIDWGGCRCQALALAGDAAATDPICSRAPGHGLIDRLIAEAATAPPPFVYRRLGGKA